MYVLGVLVMTLTTANFPCVTSFATIDEAMGYADKVITVHGFSSDLGDLAVALWDEAFELHPNRFDDNWSDAEMRAMDGE